MSQSLASKLRRHLSSKKAGKNATAILVFGAITLVFVFFGLPGREGAMGVGYVARVNNSFISIADFQNQEKQVADQMASLFGGQMPFGAQQNQFKQQALRQLIRFELANQAAQKEKIFATDAEIKDYITKDIPVFQENGQFVQERYSNYLSYMRMTAGEFEAKLRKEVNNLRLVRLFEAANVENKLATNQISQLKSQKLNLQYIKIDRNALIEGRKFIPAQVSANLKEEGFKKRVEDRFNLSKSRFDQPEEIKAQHILISVKQGDSKSDADALKKIKEVQSQVNAANFGQLAQKFSADPGSAKKGGDLGFFSQGKMTPAFEKAAFEAKPGQIVGPVKTEFGYHLIKVNERKPAKAATIKDFEQQVANQVMAEDQLDTDLKNLESGLQTGSAEAVTMFQNFWNVKWEETGFFDMSQDFVTQLPVDDLSFTTELTKEQPWVKKLVSSRSNEQFVIKLKDAKTEKPTTEVAATNNPEYVRKQKSFNFYDGFIREFEKSSTIQVNQQVLQ